MAEKIRLGFRGSERKLYMGHPVAFPGIAGQS